jgi:hypothetical protein
MSPSLRAVYELEHHEGAQMQDLLKIPADYNMVAAGTLLSSMKRALATLSSTLAMLGDQSGRMVTIAPAIKANEEVGIHPLTIGVASDGIR